MVRWELDTFLRLDRFDWPRQGELWRCCGQCQRGFEYEPWIERKQTLHLLPFYQFRVSDPHLNDTATYRHI